jgi:DNA-binding transcriptional MerR regulator
MNLDARLNRAQAAAWLNVDPPRISAWKRAGLIAPVEVTASGRTLYRLGDLLNVERQTRQSQKSSRNPWRGAQRPTFA